MFSSPSPSLLPASPAPRVDASRLRQKDDLAYQVLTVVAIVSLLASVWIF
jgi:hypothetical protein